MANATTNKPPKGWLIAGLVCLLLGIGGCTAAGVGASALVGVVDDIIDTTPFGQRTEFTARSGAGALILLTDNVSCEATDSSGRSVSIEQVGESVTVESRGEKFSTWYRFDTVDGEHYEVLCGDTSMSGTYTVLKLPSILGGVLGPIVLVGGVLGGGLFLLLGIIFLIIGFVQRSRWKKERSGVMYAGGPGGYSPPPPGAGYGDYGQPGMQPPPPGYPPAPGPQGPPPAPPAPQGPPPQGPAPMAPPPAGPADMPPPPPPGPASAPPPPPPGPADTPPPPPPPADPGS